MATTSLNSTQQSHHHGLLLLHHFIVLALLAHQGRPVAHGAIQLRRRILLSHAAQLVRAHLPVFYPLVAVVLEAALAVVILLVVDHPSTAHHHLVGRLRVIRSARLIDCTHVRAVVLAQRLLL